MVYVAHDRDYRGTRHKILRLVHLHLRLYERINLWGYVVNLIAKLLNDQSGDLHINRLINGCHYIESH